MAVDNRLALAHSSAPQLLPPTAFGCSPFTRSKAFRRRTWRRTCRRASNPRRTQLRHPFRRLLTGRSTGMTPQIDQFKRQAPGSILFMSDGTLAYAPPGKTTVRGPTGTTELEIRLSYDGGDSGTWKSVAGLSSSIDKVAWGCCTSNNKAGEFAAGLHQGGIAVELRPDIVKRGGFTNLLVQPAGCAPQSMPSEAAVKSVGVALQSASNESTGGPAVIEGQGFQSVAEAAAVELDDDAWLTGDGSMGVARSGQMQSLCVIDSDNNSTVGTLAGLITGWAGMGDVTPFLLCGTGPRSRQENGVAG